VIVAPMTTRGRAYPTRVACAFQRQFVLDQLRTVGKARLVKRLWIIDEETQRQVLAVLAEMFAP
jgi:mRNA interferase MazF